MSIAAVIPTRYEPERVGTLIELIRPEVARLIVLDNGHEPPLPGAQDARGLGIYAMWNRGWELAQGCSSVAILNDDIHVLPGTLYRLERALRSDGTLGVVYPDKYTPLAAGHPTRRVLDVVRDPAWHRTMTGFAFMARRSMFSKPPFDESYQWWCGDDAFDLRVRESGFGVARVVGLPIEHESDSERDGWARRPELRRWAMQDAKRWAAAHP